jgi:hypothetical protein
MPILFEDYIQLVQEVKVTMSPEHVYPAQTKTPPLGRGPVWEDESLTGPR